MSFEFIYDKLGLLMSFLGLILTILLISNAYIKRLFYRVDRVNFDESKIKKPNKTYLFFKRLFDFTFASLLLLLLSPIFFIIFVLIKFFINGSVINRIKTTDELSKSSYFIYVFRTFADDNNQSLNTMDNNRIKVGKLGRYLRIYSLDELPKLINIIKGDISFVGRYSYNHLEKYLKNLPKTQIDIIKEYPIGIVNLWAITANSQRKRFDYSEIFKYDMIYSSKASIFFDIYILIKTMFLFFGQKASY